ncbi:NUDIX domain-containing protein [Streptantibioticus silvisoli]|uniref:NUDIX hydrolase n=1 Tax=Streptantibioticus silvisoli TaxID=2705255 RepID=A0ABT6W9K6_9ACTN|nr:NUDIX hydrolase [Streptantibioticus silvisoli]MDI5967441.1 NUDIX hydrolase [Streptantibioticus silvisoli]
MSDERPAGWLPREEYLRTLPKTTAYASVYFTDRAGRPVLLKASYTRTDTWQNPGGTMDPGETPWQTAVRETFEETGIVVTGTRPLLLTHFLAAGDDYPYGRIGFLFDGGVLTGHEIDAIVLDPAEHSAWQVRELADWKPDLTPDSFARLTACHTARATGRAGYLESARR